jgi:hypothetical protein
MTKLFLAAGVAALALSAPVAAQGNGGGKGNKGGGEAAKVERGGGGGKAREAKGSPAKMERRGGGGQQRMAKSDRGEARASNGGGQKFERQQARNDRGDNRSLAKIDRKVDRQEIRAVERMANADRRDLDRGNWDGDEFFVPGRGKAIAEGCPPGLMAKGCMPPGQARKLTGTVIPASFRDRMLPLGLRDLYRDDSDHYYRLGDGGYVYRVNRQSNLISSLLPLFAGGLMTGQQFPSAYSNYMVPTQYQAFYPDNQDDYYRFANGYVYEVDRGSGLIENMIPLLAGGYGMGQMLPASYSAYNVPYQYRDLYADNDDYMYRYAPGAIYQVDPTTSLITGIASLLTGNGLSVGQPLPMGYSAYNVPMAYRDQYQDGPDAWYRYNNGSIYQVDPTTQLVTSIIRAIV